MTKYDNVFLIAEFNDIINSRNAKHFRQFFNLNLLL